MKQFNDFIEVALVALCAGYGSSVLRASEAGSPPGVPRFSIEYIDRSVKPDTDFFRYAAGNWIKANPVPADKSRWGGFDELQERNWFLVRQILDSCAAGSSQADSTSQKVGDFFRSALDTNRIEQLGLKPIQPDIERIAALRSAEDFLRLLADFHQQGVDALFRESVAPDAKNSGVYALYLSQGGLSLPDRDYYLKDDFAKVRQAYLGHLATMIELLGEEASAARTGAATVLEFETALAGASKSRVELRDPIAN